MPPRKPELTHLSAAKTVAIGGLRPVLADYPVHVLYPTVAVVRGSSARSYSTKSPYEHTQSTKAGAPGVDPGQLITESLLFPQRQTDVATGAPCRDREVNADRVLFGGKHRLRCCWYRGIEPTQGRGVRTTPASTRGHMWMGARTRTHELIGANRGANRSEHTYAGTCG